MSGQIRYSDEFKIGTFGERASGLRRCTRMIFANDFRRDLEMAEQAHAAEQGRVPPLALKITRSEDRRVFRPPDLLC